jgi:hypothetical protein
MDILLGVFLLILGLAITTMGVQVFFAILPMLGFVFGFFLGAGMVDSFWSGTFLSTVTGWIVGIGFGIIFALVSWFWWYAGVLLSAGVLGALTGTGFAELFEIDTEWILFLFGLAGFIAFIVVAYLINAPIYLLILSTGIAGATVLVTGLLLVLNRIDRDELGHGTAVGIINESWWWLLVTFVVAVVGISIQLVMKSTITLPSDRWEPAGTGTA